MKRPVVIVVLVYLAGLTGGSLLRLPPALALAMIGVVVLTQLISLARRRPASDLLLLVAVFLIGDVQRTQLDAQDRLARETLARFESAKTARVEGRLASTDQDQARRVVFRLEDCTVQWGEAPAVRFPTAIQLTCSFGALSALRERPPVPGDRVAARGPVTRPLDLQNPDVSNTRARLEHGGIGACLSVRRAADATFSPPSGGRSLRDSFAALGERLRRESEAVFARCLDRDAAALTRSVFLGQTGDLSREVRRDFVRCGLAHVFAVSGLNVVMMIWVLDVFLRLFRARPKTRALVLIASSFVFCAVVGFPASVLRAAFMLAALLAAPFLGYKVEPLTGLAAAALAILLLDPRALWQPGFQLSFGCMLSIILLQPLLDELLLLDESGGSPRRRRIARALNRHVLGGFTMLLAAQLGVLPLLSHYYHLVPLVGALSNVPAALLVWFLMALAPLLLAAAAVLPVAVPALAGALTFFGDALLGLVSEWSSLPAVSIFMPGWPLAACALYYGLLFGWAALPHAPSPFFAARQRARLALALAAIVAWSVWAPAVLRRAPGELRATFLDVGQGDSCLLELPGGATVLVDGGDQSVRAGEQVVLPFLDARGIDQLDAVIATHADADHVGGLARVLRERTVGMLIEGSPGKGSEAYGRLRDAVAARAVRHETVGAGDWIETPLGARLLFLHPARGAAYRRANDGALVIRVAWRECKILIAGDIEEQGEADLVASPADLACDVLRVAHHGSVSATSSAFLQRARPALAVVSCGRNNPFGHPAQAVLERLGAAGISVARTDLDGAITLRSDGREIEFRSEGK